MASLSRFFRRFRLNLRVVDASAEGASDILGYFARKQHMTSLSNSKGGGNCPRLPPRAPMVGVEANVHSSSLDATPIACVKQQYLIRTAQYQNHYIVHKRYQYLNALPRAHSQSRIYRDYISEQHTIPGQKQIYSRHWQGISCNWFGKSS